MAVTDIDPFCEHGKTDEQPDTVETIPSTPGEVIQSWEPRREQETSFRGMSQRTEVLREHVKHCIMCYLKKQVKPQKLSYVKARV